jgi:hypothetical protein
MKKNFFRLLLLVIFLAVSVVFYELQGLTYEYPLQVSSNNRYLVDQKNEPFFWSGDTAWSLIAQLSKEDAVYYLEDRKNKGFNVLLVNLIEKKFSDNAPANYYGDLPFTDKGFTTPNEAYFSHADHVISEAARRGILILLCPLYLGYGCGDEGWCSEVKEATHEDMREWGRYIGNRYKDFDNIVWCIGGDTDPTPVKDKVLQFVHGIRENNTRHMFTSHNQRGSFAAGPWPDESWLNINNIYPKIKWLYQDCKSAYQHSPTTPFFLVESIYENEHNSTQQQLRSQAYWTVLSGGFGHIFGNCPIWHFDSVPDWCGIEDWKAQLDSQGSLSMMYLQQLFKSRKWHLLEPDFQHEVLTGGYGLWDERISSLRANNFWNKLFNSLKGIRSFFNAQNYATAAITKNGTTMMAYLPSNRKIKIDMSKISGTHADCWWYKPSDGSALKIGSYPTNGTRSFVPPSQGDWIIVIDNASLNLPEPGQLTNEMARHLISLN